MSGDWHCIGVRFRRLMISVIAAGSAVFGGCAVEMDVSVELKNADKLLRYGEKWLRLFGA